MKIPINGKISYKIQMGKVWNMAFRCIGLPNLQDMSML